MSWQTYIDEHLMCDIDGNDTHLSCAAIVGHDGSVWAQSTDFPQFKPEEITAIMGDFNEPGTLAPVGLYHSGTKYMVIQGEPGAVIRGKKVEIFVTLISIALITYHALRLKILPSFYLYVMGKVEAKVHADN